MPARASWSRLSGLMLSARQLVDGLYSGGHASPRPGPGLEFHDYRPYTPGDDVAAIDWKRFGRTDRYYLRRYQRYTDLHAHLLVDISPSMAFAGLDEQGRPLDSTAAPSKLDCARELAAAIAFLAVKQSDRASLALFDSQVRQALPGGGSWAHLQRICATLEAAAPQPGVVGDVGKALAQLHAMMSRRGLVVLISDLLDDPAGLFDGLGRLRHDRSEVMVLQLLTPQELDLAALGNRPWRLRDSETGIEVKTHAPRVSDRYAALMREHLAVVRRGCLARGAEHVLLRTDQPMVEGLRRMLNRFR